MSTLLICSCGHQWEVSEPGSARCPVCGAAVAAGVARPGDDAATLPPRDWAAGGAGQTGAEAPRPPQAEATEVLGPDGESWGGPETVNRPRPAPAGDTEAGTLAPGDGGVEEAPRAEDLTLPGYEILGELGRGGMGVVYKARQVELNRLVALKMILAGAYAGSAEAARFGREAEAVARLQHPNIVQIYDVGEHEGRPFLALEYVGGGSLAQRLDGQPLPIELAAGLIETLARAVHYAHQHGVVHRDLKPANVLLAVGQDSDPVSTPTGSESCPTNPPAADWEPKITDFGLAKWLDREQGQTQSGAILGTPSYMAPEQASGHNRSVGPAADVYALGAILDELLTGRPPFQAETALETVLQLMSREPTSLRALNPRVPRDLETVCLKCLQKEPKKRYATALELAEDLRRFRAGEPIRARPTGPAERAWKWARRRPLRAAGLLLLLAALAWGGVQFGPALYRLAANRGDLVLETAEPGVRVRIRPEQGPERTVDVGERQALTLPAGTYTLALEGGPGWLELSEDRLTLRRNGRQVVQVRPIPEGEILRLEGHTGPIHGLAVSPDGRLVLSASGFPDGDGTLRLWDLHTGKPMGRLTGHTGQVLCAAFGPDGRYALSGGTDRTARLWDVTTGMEVRQLGPHNDELSALDFSPDGRLVLTASHDRTVRLWDAATGKPVRLFDGHKSMVIGAALTADGRQMMSSAHDNTVRLWDVATGAELRRCEATNQGTEAAAVSPDGRLAASPGYDRSIRLFDLTSGRLVRRLLGHTNVVSTVAFSPDGRLLVSGSMDRTVRLWDVASGAELHVFEGHGDGIRAVVFTPDGRRVLSAGGGNYEKQWLRGNDFAIRLWGLPHTLPAPAGPPTPPAAEVRCFPGHAKGVTTVRVSPDGRRLASAAPDGTIRLWDLEGGREDGRLDGHTGEVWGLAWSADGRRLLSGGDDGTVALWDVGTGRALRRLRGHQGRVWSVALSADGRRALSGGLDKTVRVWDLVAGEELGRLDGHTGPVRGVALAADGRTALSCGSEEKVVRVWDLGDLPPPGSGWPARAAALFAAGPEPLAVAAALSRPPAPAGRPGAPRTLAGHTAGVQCVAFTPDGRRALSGGLDKTVRVWDLATGQDLTRFEGHTNTVDCLTVSADGKRALSGGQDGLAVCWEVDGGREVGFCAAHAASVTGLAFAPGDRFITSSSADPVIRLWQLAEPGRPAPPALEVPPPTATDPAPNDTLGWTNRAESARLAGRWDQVVQAHTRVLDANAGAWQNRAGRGLAYARLGQFAKAAADFNQVAAERPDDLEVRLSQAALLLLVGDAAGYQRLCAALPTRPVQSYEDRAAYLVARILALAPSEGPGRERSLELSQQALAKAPRTGWYLHTRGLALYRAGRYQEAADSFRASMEQAPDWAAHVANWLGLALCEQQLGRPEEARRWLDRAVAWMDRVAPTLPPDPESAFPIHPHDWLSCLLLRREVESKR